MTAAPAQSYKETLLSLSNRIVDIQKPIRILDAIKWDSSIEAEFLAGTGRRQPKVSASYYENQSLGFHPALKLDELTGLVKEIQLRLGRADQVAGLLVGMVEQYIDVVEMLRVRGTPRFYELSRRLYGSPQDRFFDGASTVLDQGRLLHGILQSLEGKSLGQEYPKNVSADTVVRELRERFQRSFLKGLIDVRLSDGIVADAAAGSDVIKIKEGALFSTKDIDIFEVHEGWVHVATTLNGKSQGTARFLSKGPPRCASTQEGLATLMEVLTFSTYPRRARAINDRILAIAMAEDGASFYDVFEFQLAEGHSETEAFRNATRVFRGGVVDGGAPFTKDISYCRGFIENYNFIRAAIRLGRPELIPFLWAGKLHTDDIPLLYRLHLEGLVEAPQLLPPQFKDLNALAVWMGFSNFLNTVDLARVQEHYGALFHTYL